MNNFNDLAKVALNEAKLSDYIRAAGRAVTHATAATVKGAASVANTLASKSGMQYGGQFGAIAARADKEVNRMKEWGQKHKAEIEKRDLKSAPYKLLAGQQEKALLPHVGETITTVMPNSKQVVRMQVVDVETDATAAKGEEKNEAAKVAGGVTIISQPVQQRNGTFVTQFDTAITKINDINKPLQSTATTTFLKHDAATRIPQLNSIVSRKTIGNQISWQLKAPALEPEAGAKTDTGAQPEEHKSIYTDTESNRSYIFRGIDEGGWAPYNLTTKAVGTSLNNAALQKRITKAWQAQQALKTHK